MFRLIGVIVFLTVLFFGFHSFQKWYAGDATPKETVDEVRNKIGEALVTEKAKPAASPAGAELRPVQYDAQPVRAPTKESLMPSDANQLLKDMEMMDQNKK